jgi:transposase InsO family protein
MERKAYQRSQAWEKFEILETVASCPLSIRKACSELGVTHWSIPFGHPQSIGRIERSHRTMWKEELSLHRYSNPE